MSSSRIEVMPAALADQIAAGEVVERPASIVKELVENAVDAGAKRVEVELLKGGSERIVVLDDGAGMHPKDLPLALTRHATSKVREASDLVEIRTLGFRGEALASIAAVADVTMESRRAEDTAGTRMRSRPGLEPELSPVGRPVGTRVEVASLFVNVPARRKFLRSEATEVGHCTDTMVRLAISHPGVHLRLRHGPRTLLDLPSADLSERIAAVLARRVRSPITRVHGEHDGVEVEAFLAPPSAAVKGRGQTYVVVRRRVVRERSLTSAITAAYGDRLPSGHGPVACLRIDPPRGEVDVNVHPQKAEVRFSNPQAVYAAARHVLALAAAQWDGVSQTSAPAQSRFTAGAQAALDRSAKAEPVRAAAAPRFSAGAAKGSTYRLRTAATRTDYDAHRAEARAAAGRLRDRLAEAKQVEPAPKQREMPTLVPTPTPAPPEPAGPALSLLTCLPGPIALLRMDDTVLAVDLQRLRSHLVYERLVAELGGGGSVGAQGLLAPVVVKRNPRDVELCLARQEALRELGVVVEAFGEDALLVRAVPAHLRDCVDEPDIDDLVDKVVAWLRVEAPSKNADQTGTHGIAAVLSRARGADPAPRLARRWVRELIEQDRDLDKVPGIRRFRAEDLT